MVIGCYIIFYVAMYLYIAYITYKYNSNDLIQWREQQLQQLEEEYAKLPLDDTPPTIISPPS